MGIGFIDAIHSPVRGGFIAAAFVLALALSGWLALRQVPMLRWDRRLRRDTAPVVEEWPAEQPAPAPVAHTATPTAPEVPAQQ